MSSLKRLFNNYNYTEYEAKFSPLPLYINLILMKSGNTPIHCYHLIGNAVEFGVNIDRYLQFRFINSIFIYNLLHSITGLIFISCYFTFSSFPINIYVSLIFCNRNNSQHEGNEI